MSFKTIQFGKDARKVINELREFVKIDTEVSMQKADELLAQYDKYDLVSIIVEFNPAIPRARFKNKNASQVRASILLVIIHEFEQKEVI